MRSSALYDTRLENMIRTAEELLDYCDPGLDSGPNIRHLPGCGTTYLNGSPCSCGLPAFKATFDEFVSIHTRREVALARRHQQVETALKRVVNEL